MDFNGSTQERFIPADYEVVFGAIKRLGTDADDVRSPMTLELAEHSRKAESEGWPPAVILMSVVSLRAGNPEELFKAKYYGRFRRVMANHLERTLHLATEKKIRKFSDVG